jgi:hypothetical protein
MNCSLIFKSKRQYIVHLFFLFFSLAIKDKTNISLTIKILHLGQSSFSRKVRTIFTLKIIVSIFVKLFLILVLHLRQFFIVIIFVKRATDEDRILSLIKFIQSIIQALSGGHVIRAHQWVYQGNINRLVRLERGNSETVFPVLHQAYALEQSLYARDVIKWFMPCACIVIEL